VAEGEGSPMTRYLAVYLKVQCSKVLGICMAVALIIWVNVG
jgi:hypothetical protein